MVFQVFVHNSTRAKIEKYINLYKEKYRLLYADTGLGLSVESTIIDQYIRSADNFTDAIYDAIVHVLAQDTIFGYSYDSDRDIYTVTYSVESRRLFFMYREDKTTNTRTLVDIEIVRR
jgi:hypothetical protein